MSGPLMLTMREIEKALSILKQGGVIAYPTETVYGLGSVATNARAVSRIQRLKGRWNHKPMLILIPDLSFLSLVAEGIPEYISPIIQKFWPGPLTLIFKATHGLPQALTGEDSSIGVRISSDPVCQKLLDYLKAPIVSTSANPSDQPPARSAEEVHAYFHNELDAVLDGGFRDTNAPSTVIDMRFRPAVLLRRGAIDVSDIQSFIGEIIVRETL